MEKSDGVVAICFDLSFVDSAFVGVFTSAIFDFLRMALVFAIVVSISWVNNCRDARVGRVLAPRICFFFLSTFLPPKESLLSMSMSSVSCLAWGARNFFPQFLLLKAIFQCKNTDRN